MVAGDLDSGEDEPWMWRAAAEPELLRLGDRGLKGFKAGSVEEERQLHFLGKTGGMGACAEDGGLPAAVLSPLQSPICWGSDLYVPSSLCTI